MSRIWRNPNNLTGISFFLLALAAGFAGAAFLHSGAVFYILGSVASLLLAIAVFTKAFVEAERGLALARLRRTNDQN
ncbi:MAG: hypothetical protein JST42_26630 [Bacteroidetes bacterium]|nr:hypothetical protein [Bacteroidota bacterium]